MIIKTLLVKSRDVYGTRLYYPACEISRMFSSLTGKKTLSLSDLATVKKLGFQVRELSDVEISAL